MSDQKIFDLENGKVYRWYTEESRFLDNVHIRIEKPATKDDIYALLTRISALESAVTALSHRLAEVTETK